MGARVPIPKPVLRFFLKHVNFVFFFLIPFSLLDRLYRRISGGIQSFFAETPTEATHAIKTKRVQEAVREWRRSGAKTKMCTGRNKADSMMLRLPKYRDTLHRIPVHDMKDIISLDVERRVVKVEPMVSMAQLSAYLVPKGWTLPIVPELGALTVGGVIMGGGLETSSHKYGLFHMQCKSYDFVVSSGELLHCSKTENPDLFKGIPVSFGTLGFLTAIELEIIEAPQHVRLEYHPCYSLKDFLDLIKKHGTDTKRNDFVEALGFGKDKWVVMTGKMAPKIENHKLNEISWWYKPWFHKHVESFLKKGAGYDYIPLRDYYHRYDRSFGWVTSHYTPYGNNPIFRLFFGWIMPVETKFLKQVLPAAYMTKAQFIQDFLVRHECMEEIILESDRLTKLYPVWICPFKVNKKDGSMGTSDRDYDEMFYDIGVYGKPDIPDFKCEAATKEMEQLVLKHKGFQAMYADCYMTEEEICSMYNQELYKKLRKQYNAEDAFPEFVSKITVKGRNGDISGTKKSQ